MLQFNLSKKQKKKKKAGMPYLIGKKLPNGINVLSKTGISYTNGEWKLLTAFETNDE